MSAHPAIPLKELPLFVSFQTLMWCNNGDINRRHIYMTKDGSIAEEVGTLNREMRDWTKAHKQALNHLLDSPNIDEFNRRYAQTDEDLK